MLFDVATPVTTFVLIGLFYVVDQVKIPTASYSINSDEGFAYRV